MINEGEKLGYSAIEVRIEHYKKRIVRLLLQLLELNRLLSQPLFSIDVQQIK